MRRSGLLGAGDDGGNYLASVSDLMSGLIFVFIITLMVFAFAYKQQEDRLTNTEKIRTELLRDLEQRLKRRGVQVEVDEAQGILRLPEEILFPSGQATLTGEGQRAIEALSDHLGALVPCYTGSAEASWTPEERAACGLHWHPGRLDTVLIEGHTDDVPLKPGSSFRDNWYLSSARSIETYNTLVAASESLRQAKNRKNEAVIGVSGYADLREVASNVDDESRRRNRRIDLRFIMAPPTVDRSLPGVLRKAVGSS